MNDRLVAYLYAVVQQVYKDVLTALEDKSLSGRTLYKLTRIRIDTHLALHQIKPLIEPENESDQQENTDENE